MADENNIFYAILNVPNTNSPCISSDKFAKRLKNYRDDISKMIEILENNTAHNKYSMRFKLNFHRNGIDAVKYSEEDDDRMFELDCYCNGGN